MTELELIIKIGEKELRLTEVEAKELYGKLNGLFYQKQTAPVSPSQPAWPGTAHWAKPHWDRTQNPNEITCYTDGERVGSPVKTSDVSVGYVPKPARFNVDDLPKSTSGYSSVSESVSGGRSSDN